MSTFALRSRVALNATAVAGKLLWNENGTKEYVDGLRVTLPNPKHITPKSKDPDTSPEPATTARKEHCKHIHDKYEERLPELKTAYSSSSSSYTT